MLCPYGVLSQNGIELNHDTMTTETNNTTELGFIGIQYLVQKYNYPAQVILALFIDNDYSISRTADYLQELKVA
jgi:hypothetical protein